MSENVKIPYGYAGNILFVDLTDRKTWTEPTAEYSKNWIGGRAINTWILINEMSPATEWNDPGNILAVGAGVLLGTSAGGACRVSVDTKHAFNNGIGSANVGGFWGAELKYAGFDNIIIKGKATNPVYLWICDGQVEIRDAYHLWGTTTWETEAKIRDEYKDDRIRVMSIGPAGENIVKSACIICDRAAAAGGSGCGAVMGSKNLKALAVRGHLGIGVAEPEKFIKAVDTEIDRVNRWKLSKEIREKGYYGSMGGLLNSTGWDEGYRPARNGQDDYWEKEKVAKISEDVFKEYRKGTVACFSCPVACKPWMEIDSGEYQIKGEGWWNNSANAFCTKIDNTNLESAIYAHHLVNQLGLDMDNAGQAISWAFECYEKGIITRNESDGLELIWGNETALIELLRKIAYREGVGALLADGALNASKQIGKGSDEFVVHVKNQDSMDGVRINKGWGFAIIMSPVAGRHLRGGLNGFWCKEDRQPNSYEDVPEILFHNQAKKAVQDMLGLCSYVYGQTLDDWVDLLEAATGVERSEEELLLAGLREHNLEKAFNTIHTTFDRNDDYPCRRFYDEPVKSGPYKGERLDHGEWNKMLDRLYQLHEWDLESGLQTRSGLEKLDLADIADLIEKEGRLK